MEEKKQDNIDPLDTTELKENITNELFAEKKEDLGSINKKVHEGGEPEAPAISDDELERRHDYD